MRKSLKEVVQEEQIRNRFKVKIKRPKKRGIIKIILTRSL